MANAHVEQVRIESDENGWELHLVVGDDIEHSDDGRIILNIHGVAEELLSEVTKKIGPWLLDGLRIYREMTRTPFDETEAAEPWAGETAMQFYRRTGDSRLLFEHADALRKAERENPDVGA